MDVKRSSWGGGGMEGGRGTLKQMQRNVRGCQWDWWWRAHGCGELARPRPCLWLTSSPRGLLVDVTQRALWHFSASTSLWAAATLEPFPHLRHSVLSSIYLSIYLAIYLSIVLYLNLYFCLFLPIYLPLPLNSLPEIYLLCSSLSKCQCQAMVWLIAPQPTNT